MSNSLISKKGNATLPQNISTSGSPGVTMDVSVSMKSLINRATNESTINKNLKGGWNWNMYTPVIVAEFPEKFRSDPDFEEYHGNNLPLLKLLDGDHRKHMYKAAFPGEQTMPGYRIPVKTKEEYHKLFYEINWASRKNANKEEVFIHQVLAKEPEALVIELKLRRCGVSVCGSPDAGGTVGAKNSPHVTVGAFGRCLKHGESNVRRAVQLLRNCWPADNMLKGELLEGLTIMYSVYPVLSSPSSNKLCGDFVSFFNRYANMFDQREAATLFKDKGGRVHHKHGESIARGIVSHWRDSKDNKCTRKYRQKAVKMHVINDLIER